MPNSESYAMFTKNELQQLIEVCYYYYYCYIFRLLLFSLMSGKLNTEEQVQVVIRLKPTSKDQISNRSVYVSDEQEKTLVVETPNKKEYFVFDNIADDQCSQQQIYQYIGQDAVKSSTDGYNCCIFAYGQTGAGKTYSILGSSQDLLNDYYAESRGILPRLLSDLFSWCSNETDRFWIKCSYLEIYNEQVIDLLNPDLKLRQIRQDFKKGVYVEGLSEQNATNYEQAMSILMKGVKNRKTSATSMNDESSRSHTIFTLCIESEFRKDDVTTTRRSKINIVDLAGSERAKQTKVEGDRLKQGCNINKSLHCLGNVINALVESAKKKKHIPFRDSKLTHFLKDSLCGNSITKLLANIHPSKAYLGDTLSTLMFAKRAKILKMKVEVNENMTQNFEQLRKQIRKLREQLAQARYIKQQQKVERNSESESVLNIEKPMDTSNFDLSKHDQALQVFEQNQLNYKALIEVYEQHMKICGIAAKNRKNMAMHHEWKNLQKKNQSYRNIIKNMPAFTKIFKQNIKLKTGQSKQILQKSQINLNTFKTVDIVSNISILKNKDDINRINAENQLQMKLDYENLIKNIQAKFTRYIDQLESAYDELETDAKLKQQRIKQLKKRKSLPPDMEELINQNQYLKLNILQLEDQINNFQQKQRKLLIQIKELKKDKEKQRESSEQFLDHQQSQNLSNKLNQIKNLLEHDVKEHEQQRNSMLNYIQKLKQKIIAEVQQNKLLLQGTEQIKIQNKGLKKKLNSILKINNEIEITKDQNTYTNTFWTNQQSNISEDLQIFKQDDRLRSHAIFDRDENSRIKAQIQSQEQKNRGVELSNQIIKLHKSYNEEISKLRQEIKALERTRRQLTEQNFEISNKLRNVECRSAQDEKQQPRRQKKQKTLMADLLPDSQVSQVTLTHVRSTKTLQKMKQPRIMLQKSDTQVSKNFANLGIGSKSSKLQVKEEKDEKSRRG